MAAIDIGPGATTLSSTLFDASAYTILNNKNPANDTGTLTSFEMYLVGNATGLKMGTFYGSSSSWTNRDYENIGTCTGGSKQTFTGKNCEVETDDILGYVIEANVTFYYQTDATYTTYYKSGDYFGAGTQTYGVSTGQLRSMYATGETSESGWTTAKLGGIASASIIKVGGIAVASVKKVMGVSVQA